MLSRLCHGAPPNEESPSPFWTTTSVEHCEPLCETLELLVVRRSRPNTLESIGALLDLDNEPLRVRLMAAALLAIGDPARRDADDALEAVVTRLSSLALASPARLERFEVSAEGLMRFLDPQQHPRTHHALRRVRLDVLRAIHRPTFRSAWHLDDWARLANELALEEQREGRDDASLPLLHEMLGALRYLLRHGEVAVDDAEAVDAERGRDQHRVGISAALKGIVQVHVGRNEHAAARPFATEDLTLSEQLAHRRSTSAQLGLGAAVACYHALKVSETLAEGEAHRRRALHWLRPLLERKHRDPRIEQLLARLATD